MKPEEWEPFSRDEPLEPVPFGHVALALLGLLGIWALVSLAMLTAIAY